MPTRRRAKKPNRKTPKLVRLEYGTRFCELGKEVLTAGDLVAWWEIVDPNGRRRWTLYCPDCHHACVRAGRVLR